MKIKIHLGKEGIISDVMRVVNHCHFHQTGENKFQTDGPDGYALICEVATSRGGDPMQLLRELNSAEHIVSAEII